MGATFFKPRWAAWENTCLQLAFTQKISHRIMATALGRTVPSINKKIHHLGLRLPSSQPGRRKGDKRFLTNRERFPLDLQKMRCILKRYAPLEFFKKAESSFKRMLSREIEAAIPNVSFEALQSPDCGFTLVAPMEFCLSKDAAPSRKGETRYSREPLYVSLQHVEQWATAKGFHKLRGALAQRGVSYWNNGVYFSQAQLLMHVNRLRYDHDLQPLVLLEED